MKFTRFAILVALLVMAISAYAASPQEELKQLTAQLQSNPNNTALREEIIKLALTIIPAPAVPEEAERRLGRGQAAFEIAKEPADFEKAIAEFQAASNAAPWLAAPYYNLGVAQEKAKKYREAMTSFKLYLLAAPSAADAGNVKQTIFKLEFLAEQPPSEEELLRKLNGARFAFVRRNNFSILKITFDIQGRKLVAGYTILEYRKGGPDAINPPVGVYKQYCVAALKGLNFVHDNSNCSKFTGRGEISTDGRTLSWTPEYISAWGGDPTAPWIFTRE